MKMDESMKYFSKFFWSRSETLGDVFVSLPKKGVGLNYFSVGNPEHWGRNPHFEEHILRMGGSTTNYICVKRFDHDHEAFPKPQRLRIWPSTPSGGRSGIVR